MARSPEQVADLRTLSEVATTLYGSRWQTSLASVLSDISSREVSQAQVAHWATGHRPVPAWVVEILPRLLEHEAARSRRRAAWCEAKAAELRAASPDEDDGPRPG